MTVRKWSESQGVFRGWGNVALHQTLTNNGRIIADGMGTDRNLDMSSFAKTHPDLGPDGMWLPPVTNMIPNVADSNGPAHNGWFAQNHGALRLPNVSLLECGNSVCRWGEAPLQTDVSQWHFLDDPDWPHNPPVPDYFSTVDSPEEVIDLINSVEMIFAPVSSTTPVAVALLALDRDEIGVQHSYPLSETNYWPLGVWKFTPGTGATQPWATLSSLTFRYDNTMLSQSGETNVQLLRCKKTGDSTWEPWTQTTAARNTNLHTIGTDEGKLGWLQPFTNLTSPACYYVAALPGRRWVGGSADWTAPNVWLGTGTAARINNTNGVTATVSTALTPIETLVLGCTANSAANTVEVAGGSLTMDGWLRLGAVDQGAKGACQITAGQVQAGSVIVGENGTGTVAQSAGTCTIAQDLSLGLYPTGDGEYELSGGTLTAQNIRVGVEGNGSLTLGGEGGSAPQITGVKNLTVRENMHADGVLEGFGTVQCVSGVTTLTNNGKIIANSYGVDGRVLDLSNFHNYQQGTNGQNYDLGVQNTIENLPACGTSISGKVDDTATSNGWYAVNKGKLVLSAIPLSTWTVPAGSEQHGWFNWGESPHLDTAVYVSADDCVYDRELDMVNSAQLFIVRAAGTISGACADIALLAPDHPEVSGLGGACNAAAVWRVDIQGVSLYTAGTLKSRIRFRYDETLVPAEDLTIYQRVSGIWTRLDNVEVDPVNHIIEGLLTQTGLTYYAVGPGCAHEGWRVTLTSARSDLGGYPVTYAWTQTDGHLVEDPSGATTRSYSFTVPEPLTSVVDATLKFDVTIDNGHGKSATDHTTLRAHKRADINHDDWVNVGDLQALVAAWGSHGDNRPLSGTSASSNWNPCADCNADAPPRSDRGRPDGYINVGDLQALVSKWAEHLPATLGDGMEGGMQESLALEQAGEMSLMDSGAGSIDFKLVAVDPLTGLLVSDVRAPVSTQLTVKLYAQGTSSGLLAIAGDIVADDTSGALESSSGFTWAVTGPHSSQIAANGGMSGLSWGQDDDFSQWSTQFGQNVYMLLGTYTVTVTDASQPVTLTWQESPLDEWGTQGGYNGWYTTGVYSRDRGVREITPLTINTLTVTPGPVPSFVYEGWTVNLTAGGWSGYGDTLTYSWTQTAGREVLNLTVDPNTGSASFTVPTVQLTTDVPLTFTVTVTDAHDNSVTSQEVTINTHIMGDVNHNNVVSQGDLQAVVNLWGSGPGYTGPADLNRDGWVNVGDLQCVSGNWGRSLGAVAVWFTSIPGYVYEGQSAGVTCSVRSIHGDPWTCTWTQSGGWNVVDPTGATTPTYSFTVPTLLCATDTPLKFTVSVTAGQDGTAIGSVAVPAYMLGDLNFNGIVASSGPGGSNDQAAMTAAMNSHPGDLNWKAQADFDRDNDVDQDDWDLVPSWTRTLAPPVTITSATASPSFAYEGQPVNLACEASNPHGLPLVYEWCWDGGASVTLTNPLTANASFTVPTLTYTYDTPIAFYVWVDDGSSCWAYEYVTANVYLMGDVDHDNDVDSADAAAVTAAMGSHPGETGWNAAADLDGDGVITSADQQLVTTNTGRALVESQGLMGGSFGGESLSVDAAMDGVETLAGDTPAGAAAGPVDSYGLTFEQALQRVGLLEEWLEYKATQPGQ